MEWDKNFHLLNLAYSWHGGPWTPERRVHYDARGLKPNSDFGESEYPDYAYEFEYFWTYQNEKNSEKIKKNEINLQSMSH